MSGVMIVTGGSRGIGAAISQRAARAGFDVCVNYARAKDRAEEVVHDVTQAGQTGDCRAGRCGNGRGCC